MTPRPAVTVLSRVVALLRREVDRQREKYLLPFGSRGTQDPLFRAGLAASVVVVWSILVTTLALGDGGSNPVPWILAFLTLPVSLNFIVFGVVVGSARGFWRGLSGKASNANE